MRWSIGVALAWGMVAGGAVLLGFGLFSRLEAEESEGWPATPGRITETSIVEEQVREAGRPRYRTEYRPVVRYEYRVGGVTYTGDRIAIEGNQYRRYGQAYLEIDEYPTGSEVTVYYDPDRPERAVLEVGMGWDGTVLMTVGGLVIGGVGLLFVWLGRFSPYRPNGPRVAEVAGAERAPRRVRGASRRARRRRGGLGVSGEGR